MLSRALLDPPKRFESPALPTGCSAFTPAGARRIQHLRHRRAGSQLPGQNPLAKRPAARHLVQGHRDRLPGRQPPPVALFMSSATTKRTLTPPPRQPPKRNQSLPPRHYPEWDYSSQSYARTGSACTSACTPAATPVRHRPAAGQTRGPGQTPETPAGCCSSRKTRCGALPGRRQRAGPGRGPALIDRLQSGSHARPAHQHEPHHRRPQHCGDRAAGLVGVAQRKSTWLGANRAGAQPGGGLPAGLGGRATGRPVAIAGFHSNTRHDVRYLHLKGFGEHWGDAVKGRLAAMQAAYSTRMGAAMRHAARTLARKRSTRSCCWC
jgi:nitric oxide reductase NorD protein